MVEYLKDIFSKENENALVAASLFLVSVIVFLMSAPMLGNHGGLGFFLGCLMTIPGNIIGFVFGLGSAKNKRLVRSMAALNLFFLLFQVWALFNLQRIDKWF